MELLQIPHYAILSGLFGTAASVFGKFISYSDTFLENISTNTGQNEVVWWSLKIICIALMVLCNVFVWTFFVKALNQPGGSIVATVTATATNYCCSAAAGSWLFDEQISLLWWIGTTFVMIGLLFVSLGSREIPEREKTN